MVAVEPEAMVLGIRSGLDPHMVCELIGIGAGSSHTFRIRAFPATAPIYAAAQSMG